MVKASLWASWRLVHEKGSDDKIAELTELVKRLVKENEEIKEDLKGLKERMTKYETSSGGHHKKSKK